MKCVNCGHIWVAVYPITATRIACPECGWYANLLHMDATTQSGGDNETWCTSWYSDYAQAGDDA